MNLKILKLHEDRNKLSKFELINKCMIDFRRVSKVITSKTGQLTGTSQRLKIKKMDRKKLSE